MTEKKLLMDKDQVLNFNLLAVYWNYLLSLRGAFEQELQKKFKNGTIDSWIESVNNLFLKSDEHKTASPQLEKVYFRLKKHAASVRICIPCGDVPKMYLELVEDEKNGTHYYPTEEFCGTSNVFSTEMIEAAAEWLKEGTVNDTILENFGYFS